MGSNMKTTIFNEQVTVALRKWHRTAKNNIKQSKNTSSNFMLTSTTPSPSHHLSPLHLLNHRSDTDSLQTSPSIRSDLGMESDNRQSSSALPPSHHYEEASTSYHESDHDHLADEVIGSGECSSESQHVIDIENKEFSFGRKVITWWLFYHFDRYYKCWKHAHLQLLHFSYNWVKNDPLENSSTST